MNLVNTHSICCVFVEDPNREDGVKMIDLGNYFKNDNGDIVLVTSMQLAVKYGHLVKEKIFVRKV